MHSYVTPEYVKQAVMQRQGKARANEVIDAARAALVVVDMQNYFVAEDIPTAVPLAQPPGLGYSRRRR
jgi:ureidoacrylate peracid hydrolase